MREPRGCRRDHRELPEALIAALAELKQVERRLAEAEADFAKNLTLLKREVLDEEEFRKANEARRDERTRLTRRQTELAGWLASRLGIEKKENAGGLFLDRLNQVRLPLLRDRR